MAFKEVGCNHRPGLAKNGAKRAIQSPRREPAREVLRRVPFQGADPAHPLLRLIARGLTAPFMLSSAPDFTPNDGLAGPVA